MTAVAEVVELAAPPISRPAGVGDYVSASRLNLWLRCPRAFELRYVKGVPTRTSLSMFFGKQIHAALEVFWRHWQFGLWLDAHEVANHLELSWNEAAEIEGVAFPSGDKCEALKNRAVRLVTHYLNELPANEPKPLAVETTLEAPLVDPESGEYLEIPLVGVLDLVTPCDSGAVICDFKTAASAARPLEISHEVQLGCYAYLFRQLSGQKEAGLEIRSLVKTKTPQANTWTFQPRSESHFRRLFAVVRAYLDDLDAGKFMYRPGWSCCSCQFRDGCQPR